MYQEHEGELFSSITQKGVRIEDRSFTDCEFVDCVFEDLQLVNITFLDCAFSNCQFNQVSGFGSRMRSSKFTDCTLKTITWSQWASGSSFYDPFTLLQNCKLRYVQFTEMNLNRFHFSGCEIADSLFGDCKLASADFRGCNLERTEFFRCDIEKADFRDALGYQVDIMNCKLKGAKFSVPEAINLLGGLGIKLEY